MTVHSRTLYSPLHTGQVIEAGKVKTKQNKTGFSITKLGFLSPNKIKKNIMIKRILGVGTVLCILGEIHEGLKRKMKTKNALNCVSEPRKGVFLAFCICLNRHGKFLLNAFMTEFL